MPGQLGELPTNERLFGADLEARLLFLVVVTVDRQLLDESIELRGRFHAARSASRSGIRDRRLLGTKSGTKTSRMPVTEVTSCRIF